MKRIILIAACFVLALMTADGQTLEQRKICALKWTLQQAFYNKQEGQQIAHIEVTEYKSLADFQKNKLIAEATKKLTDKSDLARVNRIAAATAEADVTGAVPGGAKKEYQHDVDKMKAMAPAPQPEPEPEAEETQQEEEAEPQPQPQPAAEPEPTPATADENATDDTSLAATQTPTDNMSFVAVALTCLAIYAILSLCLYFFIRSRHNTSRKQEEMVTMEQYRSERLRLIERIKALEIGIEDMRDKQLQVMNETAKAVTPAAPTEPQTELEPQPEPLPIIEIEPQPETLLQSEPLPEPEPEPLPVIETPEPEPLPQSEPVTDTIELQPESEPQPEPVSMHQQPTLFEQAEEPEPAVEHTTKPIPTGRMKSSVVMFYSIPTDGLFTEGTTDIEPGRSFYMLKTLDGQTGTFQILNTPETISEALRSMSEYVKPACKILNTIASPVEILAEKPGQVVREGDGWRITSKALVRLI